MHMVSTIFGHTTRLTGMPKLFKGWHQTLALYGMVVFGHLIRQHNGAKRRTLELSVNTLGQSKNFPPTKPQWLKASDAGLQIKWIQQPGKQDRV
jgi:hypothetical protein